MSGRIACQTAWHKPPSHAAPIHYGQRMGWVWIAVLGCLGGGILVWGGVARSLWSYAAAALLLGAAGYAWQQHAGLPGHPVKADAEPIAVDPGMVAFREAIMPGAPGDDLTLATADGHLRDGDPAAAADAVLQALARDPSDATLWTGLGSAIVARDGGQLSPAAKFAFRRALSLAPRAPGPSFFLGLAQVQAGDFAAAKRAWLVALAETPANATYRGDIAEHLAMLDQVEAMSRR